MIDDNKLFSLVLRTKNEISNIKNFVQSVKNQTYPYIEFIIVDNFSTDGTLEWLKNQNLSYHLKGNERVSQGNYGMLELAQGRWVGYFDADMYLSSNLVMESVQEFEADDDLVALRIRETILGTSFGSRLRRFERKFYENTCIDAARIFTRSSILQAGGFDQSSFLTPSAEDWDLDRRINAFGKVGFLKVKSFSNYDIKTIKFISCRGVKSDDKTPCFFHNESNFTWRWYFNKKIYYTKSIPNYIKKWGKNDEIVRKQLGIKYRFFVVFFENQKYFRVLQSPHLMIVLWVQLICVGMIYQLFKKYKRSITKPV
jgi:glycosyltransferase involved in cell wall biosynthesis